jgi:ATP-dependent helicase YprA (DUF1998 family)
VKVPRRRSPGNGKNGSNKRAKLQEDTSAVVEESPMDLSASKNDYHMTQPNGRISSNIMSRRHSANETALLLALAVSLGVRIIAFCKTRGLVEWVYERTLAALKESPKTEKLTSKVESHQGGYTKLGCRQI